MDVITDSSKLTAENRLKDILNEAIVSKFSPKISRH